MDLSFKKLFLLDAKDRLKIAEFWLAILLWIMIKLKFMEQELEFNHWKKYKKFHKLKK